MKALSAPRVPDRKLLKQLAARARTGGGVQLALHLSSILRQYAHVRVNRGNVLHIPSLAPPISNALKAAFNYWFQSPDEDFRYIERIRKKLSPDVCPMCGSSAPTSVDHVLTRKMYPELILFSLNLVPACTCNELRRTDPLQAPLHPYFDEALLNLRLVKAEFTGEFQSPDVSFSPSAAVPVGDRARVDSHIRCVLIPRNIENALIRRWVTITARPESTLALPKGASVNDVQTALLERRDTADSDYGTPNNWESILFDAMSSNMRIAQGISAILGGTPITQLPAL